MYSHRPRNLLAERVRSAISISREAQDHCRSKLGNYTLMAETDYRRTDKDHSHEGRSMSRVTPSENPPPPALRRRVEAARQKKKT